MWRELWSGKFNDAKTAVSLARLNLPHVCGEAAEEPKHDHLGYMSCAVYSLCNPIDWDQFNLTTGDFKMLHRSSYPAANLFRTAPKMVQ